MQMSPWVNVAPLAVLLAACATTGADAAKVPLDPLAGAAQTAALGSIVRYRNGQVLRCARASDGAYVNSDFPGTRIVLDGEATRLDDPPWPHLALAALAMQWGEGEALWTPP